MADFKLLSQDEQDETIVEYMESQERDLFTHTICKERFEAMLVDLPEGPLKAKYEQLLKQVEERIAEVSALIKATAPQLPPQVRMDSAKSRIAARAQPK